MTYLKQRAPGNSRATFVSIGVRGEGAAEIVAWARAHARARGVTFGSLVMEALSEYMTHTETEALMNAAEARGSE